VNRSIKTILTLSVVLNVLLAGMLLGDVSHRLIAPQSFDVSAQLAQFPQDKRNLFETIMGPAKQKMDTERAKIDEAKREAIRILKSDSFNADSYLKQIRHIEDIHFQMKQHISEAVANLAKQLTPQERTALAEIISHPPFAMPIGTMLHSKPANMEQ
jgi:uncharacterized membrane protein